MDFWWGLRSNDSAKNRNMGEQIGKPPRYAIGPCQPMKTHRGPSRPSRAAREDDSHMNGEGVCGRPVSRVLSRASRPVGRPFIWTPGRPGVLAVHHGGRAKTARGVRRRPPPNLTLLPAGLAMPPPSPGARWALTPPFHPCRPSGRIRGPAVCSLWRFPSGLPGRTLSGAISSWSPDFPHRPGARPARRDRPAVRTGGM